MSDAYVQVSPDSTGKKVRTNEITVGSDTVEQQVVQLADDTGNDVAPIFGAEVDQTTQGGIVVQGLVDAARPQSYKEGQVRPLSITSDGYIRAAVVAARTAVAFFSSDQEAQWGQGPSLTPGSPWGDW